VSVGIPWAVRHAPTGRWYARPEAAGTVTVCVGSTPTLSVFTW
jgi:hypothetical protein